MHTYFALICSSWKSETQAGPLRKYTACAETNTHTDSTLALVSINACSNGCRPKNSEAWGSDRYPHAHPLLSTDGQDYSPRPPLFLTFMGPLIMLTCHIKIHPSMQCLLYEEEVSWSDSIKGLSEELVCNLAAQVWTWGGKGAAAPSRRLTV